MFFDGFWAEIRMLLWGIYTSILTWTYSQNSLVAAEAPSLRYPPMEHLPDDHEDHPKQLENSHKLCNEWGQPVVNLMETERTTWSEFPNDGKPL